MSSTAINEKFLCTLSYRKKFSFVVVKSYQRYFYPVIFEYLFYDTFIRHPLHP